MGLDLHLGLDVAKNPFLVENEGHAVGIVAPQDPVLLGRARIRIGEQLKVEFLLLRELGEISHAVGADAVDLDVEGFKVIRCVPQRANFNRSPRRHGLGEEGQDGPIVLGTADRSEFAVVVVESESGGLFLELGKLGLLVALLRREGREGTRQKEQKREGVFLHRSSECVPIRWVLGTGSGGRMHCRRSVCSCTHLGAWGAQVYPLRGVTPTTQAPTLQRLALPTPGGGRGLGSSFADRACPDFPGRV